MGGRPALVFYSIIIIVQTDTKRYKRKGACIAAHLGAHEVSEN